MSSYFNNLGGDNTNAINFFTVLLVIGITFGLVTIVYINKRLHLSTATVMVAAAATSSAVTLLLQSMNLPGAEPTRSGCFNRNHLLLHLLHDDHQPIHLLWLLHDVHLFVWSCRHLHYQTSTFNYCQHRGTGLLCCIFCSSLPIPTRCKCIN